MRPEVSSTKSARESSIPLFHRLRYRLPRLHGPCCQTRVYIPSVGLCSHWSLITSHCLTDKYLIPLCKTRLMKRLIFISVLSSTCTRDGLNRQHTWSFLITAAAAVCRLTKKILTAFSQSCVADRGCTFSLNVVNISFCDFSTLSLSFHFLRQLLSRRWYKCIFTCSF